MKKLQLRYSVLILSFVIMFSGVLLAWGVQNQFGGIVTSEIDLVTEDGVRIHGTLQVPLGVSSVNPVPGVVAIHGFASTNEMMRAFSIELARRGCVVLSIDVADHGDSDPSPASSTDRGGKVAVEYLNTLPYVNSIGMVGHSMGAGISLWTALNSTVDIDAVVLIAGGVGYSGSSSFNASIPNNVLVAVGAYDELVSLPGLFDSLIVPFNASPVHEGQVYGNFTEGTARKLIITPSNHLTELIEPRLVSETVGWFENSLKQSSSDPDWIPKEQLIYPLFSVGGFFAICGLLLSIFPLFVILLETKTLKHLKTGIPSPSLISQKEY
ncbi:MAG: dienelactone hydrolase family protein, partial [Candidatus Ranarchaeia archaeon]